MAADHGIVRQGVSAYPAEVTPQMVLNFLHGGAAINCLARVGGIELRVVDVGVAETLPEVQGLIARKVAAGSRNFSAGPAMTDAETRAAIEVGIEMANGAAADGCNLLGFGEMGIGNTTPASALASVLTGLEPSLLIGRGAGADNACLARKTAAIERGLALHAGHLSEPLEMLARVGGLEIAAMCGFCLGAAANRRPVLTDGFIATSGAALAVRLAPAVKDYLFAAHGSVEPGHRHLLALIGHKPLLDLNMRLGEGTGAALAMKLVQASAEAFLRMATFASAGVSDADQPVVQA
jgi:nicotinate-nucleotide--dimethylbenzimidazole phosphoribosyltransferase